MADPERLLTDIRKFIEVYKILSPEAKAAFEAQMDKLVQNADAKSKNLYRALHRAAKDGLSVEEAIEKMKKANPE